MHDCSDLSSLSITISYLFIALVGAEPEQPAALSKKAPLLLLLLIVIFIAIISIISFIMAILFIRVISLLLLSLL